MEGSPRLANGVFLAVDVLARRSQDPSPPDSTHRVSDETGAVQFDQNLTPGVKHDAGGGQLEVDERLNVREIMAVGVHVAKDTRYRHERDENHQEGADRDATTVPRPTGRDPGRGP